jgi:hypothetical protein
MIFNAYENALVRPLFYDALSGEFKPAVDPQKRSHTLGRLMFAALSKGQRQATSLDDWHTTHLYTPSWAPNVSTEVICMIDEEVNSNALVSRISLEHLTDKVEFRDATYEEEEDSGVVIIDANGRTVHPLDLGQELSATRSAVINRTQQFFDELRG